MDRKEAILRIKDHMEHHGIGKYPHLKLKEALDMAVSALRPVSRDQVEKVWRGEWQVCFEEWQNHRVEGEQCSKCGFQNYGPSNLYNFCPKCGALITDEAVDMVMERLEALRDE